MPSRHTFTGYATPSSARRRVVTPPSVATVAIASSAATAFGTYNIPAVPMDSMGEASKQNGQPEKRKRKRKGRSSRRRQKKLQDIQQAEERLLSGDNSTELVTQTTVPTDRHKVWPGVLERRGKDGLTAADETAIVGQLGYLPGNIVRVAARAEKVPLLPVDDNVPIVLKLYPLAIRDVFAGGKSEGRKCKGRRRGKSTKSTCPTDDDGVTATNTDTGQDAIDKEEVPLLEPFPTQYWLTHPILRTLTSKLEVTDHVREMEERLSSNPKALESMRRAHQEYGQERWESLTNDDLKLIKERKWEPALDSRRGVAGITRHTTIKCLHTHLAHYLSGGRGSDDNVVGKWVMDSIAEMLEERMVASETGSNEKGIDDNQRAPSRTNHVQT